jgi:urease alpha subunit
MFPAPVLGAVGTASLGGTFGLLAGLLGLTVMPATWGIARMLRADDDETLEHVQAYNREQARDAGLDEAEIPFTFLGY